VAAGAAGLVVAGVLTPQLVRRFGRPRVVIGGLLLACVGLVGLGLPTTVPTLLGAAFVVTFCGQTVKLNVDAAIQRDVVDQSRGRVFAVSDTVFNAAMVIGVTVVAAIVPMNGRSPGVVLGTAAVYLVGLAGYALVLRAHPNSPR
jgi:MFS family permease